MNQQILIEAVGKHLDGIASLLNWFIATAFVMTFAGLTRQETLEVLGVKVKSRDAFNVAALITLVTLAGMFLLLLRLLSIMSSLDDGHFVEGLTRLTTHDWYLSPFSFFGNSTVAYLHGTLSYFLFFTALGLAALPLAALQRRREKYRLRVLFLQVAVGVGIALAVWGIHFVTLTRLRGASADLYNPFSAAFMWKTVSLTICPVVYRLVKDWLLKDRDAG